MITKYAELYLQKGLMPVPLKANKRPWHYAWTTKNFELSDFKNAEKIGIRTGDNGLEMLDFDLKYDLTGSLYDRFCAAIPSELRAKMVIQSTMSGGYHWWYFCPENQEPNQKLASRPAIQEEINQEPKEKAKVLIETRGIGGQGAVFPSEGYALKQGDFLNINTITAEERRVLIEAALSFDLMPAKKPAPVAAPAAPKRVHSSDATKPSQWFNENHSCDAILEAHGWVRGKQSRDGKGRTLIEYARPGKATGEKSGSYYPSENIFYPQTTSSELNSQKPHRPFDLLMHFEHNGDFNAALAAVKALMPRRPERGQTQANTDEIRNADLVLIVSTEKAMTAAKQLLSPLAVAVLGSVRLEQLHGKKIIIWPAHSVQHYEAAERAMAKLKDHCSSVQFVRNPSDAPKGWDLADAQWTAEEAQAYLKENRFVPSLPEPQSEPQPQHQEQMQERVHDSRANNPYFRSLGMGKSEGGGIAYFFYNIRSKLIVRFTPSGMTQNNLISLADQSWWELEFPSESKKYTVEWPSAVNWLINSSNQKGLFDPSKIRGRGVWMDAGRIVVHVGDKLIVDGKETELHKHAGEYLYEAGYTLDINTQNPLSQTEAERLLRACSLCNWERDVNAVLLAGYCVIAPICGAFSWRPHIWLTGSAGTGKSWIYKNILSKMLGKTALRLQGVSSEPGIRQNLNGDARPVVFEEFEVNDANSKATADAVLVLARSSSADDTGIIAKGSTFGAAKNYDVRSCFAMASINVSLKDQQDRRRFTILAAKSVAKSKEADDRFNALKDTVLGMDDDFRRRLQARSIAMLRTILHNTEVFTDVAAALLGKQAYGDQLGPLLAGAWSLKSDGKISKEEAKRFIEGQDWEEERALDTTKDETSCLAHILQSMVYVEGEHGRVERSVGDLVDVVRNGEATDGVQYMDAVARLRRMGIIVDAETGYMAIANASKELEGIFKGKEKWQNNHALSLKRIEGATCLNSTYFSTGIKCRAVGVPLTILD